MAKESRVKKTLLNMRMNLIAYGGSIVVAFLTRKIFLDRLGAEFIGLSTTVNSLLGFLNLAELGVGTSIAYFLYKPLYDKDEDKINETISIMGYLYRLIGFFILGSGIIFSFFLPFIFDKADIPWGVIYYCFYAQVFCSLLSYFVNYKANTVFSADQRYYLITGYFQVTQFLQTIVQMLLALFTANFYIYITVTIVFAIVNSIILNWKFNRTYPNIKTNCSLGRIALKKRPEILVYVRRVFIHQIGGFINSNVMPLIMYGYASLTTVTYYANYALLNGKIGSLLGTALAGTNASVGNLIAEGNQEKTYQCFKELFSIKFFAMAFCSICLFQLNSAFISVWLGEKYVMSRLIVFLIVGDYLLTMLRDTTEQFLNGFGLKADVWVPASRVISLIFVAIAGYFYGMVGILAVPFLFQLLVLHLWKPYYLFHSGLHLEYWKYWRLFFYNCIPFTISYSVSVFILKLFGFYDSLPSNWVDFICYSVVFSVPLLVVSSIVSFMLPEGIRTFVIRFYRLIRKHNTR